MSEIGTFESKTHLPRLLKRVQAGERFIITRHNRPVAELIPFRTHHAGKIEAEIDELKAFQKAHDLGGLSAPLHEPKGLTCWRAPDLARERRGDVSCIWRIIGRCRLAVVRASHSGRAPCWPSDCPMTLTDA